MRNVVRIGGYELWNSNNDGLIAESKGHFDSAEYERQLKVRSRRLVPSDLPGGADFQAGSPP